MSAPTINGDMPKSYFLDHLASWPIVSDSISTIRSNPVGQKSLSLADKGYATFAKPFLPYLSKPYQYVDPYVRKADQLADSGLSNVDARLPFVKKPTSELRDNITDLAFFPLRKAGEGKEYVMSTFHESVKNAQKEEGNVVVAYPKAVLTTGIMVASETLIWLSNILSAKKDQAKREVDQKMNN